jgi:hypothetical protein
VTVTISQGVVIKGSGNTDCLFEEVCTISVEGTLDATGSAESPVIFTSINDNTVGGVTGTGSPAAGDWGGIAVDGGGSMNLDDTTVTYAVANLQGATSGTVVLDDDTFSNSTYASSIDAPAPTVENDIFTDDPAGSADAVNISSSSFDLNLLGNNTGSRTGGGTIMELNGSVTTSSTLSNQPMPWGLDSTLNIPAGVTVLTKSRSWGGVPWRRRS